MNQANAVTPKPAAAASANDAMMTPQDQVQSKTKSPSDMTTESDPELARSDSLQSAYNDFFGDTTDESQASQDVDVVPETPDADVTPDPQGEC